MPILDMWLAMDQWSMVSSDDQLWSITTQYAPHAGVVLRVAHARLEPLRLAVGHALPAAALALLDALRPVLHERGNKIRHQFQLILCFSVADSD